MWARVATDTRTPTGMGKVEIRPFDRWRYRQGNSDLQMLKVVADGNSTFVDCCTDQSLAPELEWVRDLETYDTKKISWSLKVLQPAGRQLSRLASGSKR